MSVIAKSVRLGSNINRNSSFDITSPLKKAVIGESYLNKLTRMVLLGYDELNESMPDPEIEPYELGICVATYGAYFDHIANQYTEICEKKKPFISPVIGVNNTPNAICSQMAIYCQAKSFAETINDFCTAGFEALVYSFNAIRQKKAKRVFVAGCDTLSPFHTKLLHRDEKELTSRELPIDEVVVCLISDKEDKTCNSSNSFRYVAHSRGHFKLNNKDDYKNVLTGCLRKITKAAEKEGVTIDTVMLGSLEKFWDVEKDSVKNMAFSEQKIRILSFDEKDSEIKNISALSKLNSLSYMYNGQEKTEDVNIIQDNPGAGKNAVLIIDNGFDGSLGCLLLDVEG